eukprot:541577-Alexandrium_andersonii.AAC.1
MGNAPPQTKPPLSLHTIVAAPPRPVPALSRCSPRLPPHDGRRASLRGARLSRCSPQPPRG